MNTFTESQTLVTENCCQCGVLYAMPRGMQENRRNNGGNFYCPNGHPQIYAKPRVKELEAELEHKENALRASKCETLQERNAKEAAENYGCKYPPLH